jgi:hypothetical protein
MFPRFFTRRGLLMWMLGGAYFRSPSHQAAVA